MHKRAVTCSMCHQQFFPASIKFHVKVCAAKQDHIQLPCDYCGQRVQCTALKAHMKFCERRSEGRERTAGNFRRLRSHQVPMARRRQGGVDGACCNTPTSGADSGPGREERPVTAPPTAEKYAKDAPLESDTSAPLLHDTDRAGSPPELGSNGDDSSRQVDADGRVACSNCRRRFSTDRVGVHEDICKRVNAAATRDDESKHEKRKKTPKTSKPKSASCQRRSSRPAFGGRRAAARPHVALGSFTGEQKHLDRHVAYSAGNRTSSRTTARVWGASTDDQDQVAASAMPRPSSSGVPLSAGAANQETCFSGRETSWPLQSEGRRRRRGVQHHQLIRDLCPSERGVGAAPAGERLERYRRTGRPASAAGRASFSGLAAAPLAAMEGSRTRVLTGRAVSMSRSPIRLRRSRTSLTTRPAHSEGRAQQSRAISIFGNDSDKCRADFFGKSSKASGRAAVDRMFRTERSLGGRGFFSPSREGGRVRLLK